LKGYMPIESEWQFIKTTLEYRVLKKFTIAIAAGVKQKGIPGMPFCYCRL
jgi:hypothetical protein